MTHVCVCVCLTTLINPQIAKKNHMSYVYHCEVRVWCGVVWCGVVWCGVVWCGVVACDKIR